MYPVFNELKHLNYIYVTYSTSWNLVWYNSSTSPTWCMQTLYVD